MSDWRSMWFASAIPAPSEGVNESSAGCEIDPKGIMAKLMSPMIASMLGKQMAQDLGKLKSVVEG